MSRRAIAAVLIAMPVLLGAAAGVRSLPADLYPKLKRGEVLKQVWVDPSYDKKEGFALRSVVSKAEGRERELRDLRNYLEREARKRARKDSPNRMDLVLVEYAPTHQHHYAWPYTMHRNGNMTVEGLVRNRAGKIIVAFRISSEFGELSGSNSSVDTMLADLDQELL